MGICLSSRTFAADGDTAKLILQDGRLEELPCPVSVSQVLQSYDPTCFICDSDEMEFDDAVCAVNADEELRPGCLYFALPLSCLGRPMQAQDMAALAVMASTALMRRAAGHRGCLRKVLFPVEGPRLELQMPVYGCNGGSGDVGCPRGKDRRRKFMAELSAIPE
ncbi:hypothetical protein SAY87_017186 [Trapa incisa]|uniref:Uncharacterized protein n=1 Tax=Trapa incisa TaxID=236973 RepID=A0AAN7L9Y4_9MYRT|nr:hypothetical protein SAY87_017186 [Trapa incisa]